MSLSMSRAREKREMHIGGGGHTPRCLRRPRATDCEITSDRIQLKRHAADSYERIQHGRVTTGDKQKITGINAECIEALLGPLCSVA